jgi:2-(1,2-epoxy-1,2-dihydrophenyl)acetyl-CoA isomerase
VSEADVRAAKTGLPETAATGAATPRGGVPTDARLEPGAVARLVLDRPARLNALTLGMAETLPRLLRQALEDPDTRVVVVTGAGRAFCAGADIGLLRDLVERQDREAFARLVDAAREVLRIVHGSPKPVIAAVNGAAAGGGANLALACDLRLASDAASIGQTFVRIGLHPDWGGTWLLPRIVGTSRALELFWTGRMVPAEEARELGIFHRVIPASRFEAEVAAFASSLAAAPAGTLGRIKGTVLAAGRASLEETLDLELAHQLALFSDPDTVEGLRAFLEKRRPAFRGAPGERPPAPARLA